MGIGGTLVTVHVFCHDSGFWVVGCFYFGRFILMCLVLLSTSSLSVFLLTCVPLVSLYLCSCASSQFLPCPLCSCIILYDSWFVLTFVFLIICIFFPWLSFVCLCCLPWEFWDFWTLHFSLSSKLAVCYFSFLPMCVSCIWVHSVKKTCFVMLNLALKMQKKS